MGGRRGHREEGACWREGYFDSRIRKRQCEQTSLPLDWKLIAPSSQTKLIETTEAALHDGVDPNLPPLMNPTMLEASEDLTNLSHLNEPAGVYHEGDYARSWC
jgi:myosin V